MAYLRKVENRVMVPRDRVGESRSKEEGLKVHRSTCPARPGSDIYGMTANVHITCPPIVNREQDLHLPTPALDHGP